MADIIQQLKKLSQEKKVADAELKSHKLKLGVDTMNKRIKELKEKLYQHMKDNDLNELEGISIDKLLPADEKKEVLKEKRKEKISVVLVDRKVKNVEELAELIASSL